jgi:valyl-tRNA synthetase
VKTIMSSGSLAEQQRCRQILYVCADTALRLISPFMPFISEELWQRLPNKHSKSASICVTEYPKDEQVCCLLFFFIFIIVVVLVSMD